MPCYIEFPYTSTPSLTERGVIGVKRSTAGRAIRDSALRPNERLVLFALLDRANNDDCVIPHWLAPSLTAVQHDTGLARSTVAAALAHLELHGWLVREGQKRGQVARTKLSGRLKSVTRWSLLPHDFVPGDCSCTKPDSPHRGPSERQIGRETDHLDSPSGVPVSAGQTPDSSKGLRDKGSRWEVMENWPDDTIGNEVNAAENGRMNRE